MNQEKEVSTYVNIDGIDKIKLLKELWENAKQVSVKPLQFDFKRARRCIYGNKCCFISLFRGRIIGASICNKVNVRTNQYNCYNGYGKFEHIVNELRIKHKL